MKLQSLQYYFTWHYLEKLSAKLLTNPLSMGKAYRYQVFLKESRTKQTPKTLSTKWNEHCYHIIQQLPLTLDSLLIAYVLHKNGSRAIIIFKTLRWGLYLPLKYYILELSLPDQANLEYRWKNHMGIVCLLLWLACNTSTCGFHLRVTGYTWFCGKCMHPYAWAHKGRLSTGRVSPSTHMSER